METKVCVSGNNKSQKKEKPPGAECISCHANERTAVNWVRFGRSCFSRLSTLRACARNEKCNKKGRLLLIWIKTLLLCWDLHVSASFKGILYFARRDGGGEAFPEAPRQQVPEKQRSSVWVSARIFPLDYKTWPTYLNVSLWFNNRSDNTLVLAAR